MIETGVNLTLQSNVAAEARQSADALKGIAEAADGVNQAFDPKSLEQYNQSLQQTIQLNNQLQNQQKQQSQWTKALSQAGSGLQRGVVQAGTGNVVGGATTAGGGLKGLAGMLGGGVAGLAVGGLMAGLAGGNALADYQQKREGSAKTIAALEDQLYTDINENTQALRQAMSETVNSVARFGKTYEEGAQARATFLRAGGTNYAGSRAAQYSSVYGADFSSLSAFEGMTQRYGSDRGLNDVRALMRAQGLGPAQFEEVMGGIESSLSGFLSQGISKTTGEIARQQEFFTRGQGATWQGGLGAQRVSQLNQATAGMAGMNNQTDMFMYRAASQLTGGNLLETKKMMEGGLTPELFQGLMGQLDQFGYGKDESVLQLSKMFGIGTQAAEDLYGMRGKSVTSKDFESAISGGLVGTGRTTGDKITEGMELLKQGIADTLGAGALDTKAGIMGGAMKNIGGFLSGTISLKELLGRDEWISSDDYAIKTPKVGVELMTVGKVEFADAKSNEILTRAMGSGGQEYVEMIEKAKRAGVSDSSLGGALSGLGLAMGEHGPGGSKIMKFEMIGVLESLERLIEAVQEPSYLEGTVEAR